MIDALTRPRWLWGSIALGVYAALIALARTPASAAAMLVPAALGCLCWWVSIGPPNRWLLAVFCAASGPGVADAGSARTLFFAGVASALFACVDFYFQFPAPAGFGPQYVWLDSGIYRRAQGLFYEASTLGNFCAFFLVMVAMALLRPKEQGFVSRPVLLCGAALFSAALVLSYSRASLLNVAIAVVTLLWLHRSPFRFRQIGWLAAPVTAARAAATYY